MSNQSGESATRSPLTIPQIREYMDGFTELVMGTTREDGKPNLARIEFGQLAIDGLHIICDLRQQSRTCQNINRVLQQGGTAQVAVELGRDGSDQTLQMDAIARKIPREELLQMASYYIEKSNEYGRNRKAEDFLAEEGVDWFVFEPQFVCFTDVSAYTGNNDDPWPRTIYIYDAGSGSLVLQAPENQH